MRLAELPRLAQAGLELSARRVVEGLYGGRHRSPYTGSATEFHDHRPYLPGDDLRAIDWKAYARSDRLLIRRYREERDLPLTLVLDSSASMAYGSEGATKGAWARLAAAALGLLAVEQGDRMRLLAGAGGVASRGAERGGPAAASVLCQELDALPDRGDGTVDALLTSLAGQLERRNLIVLFSDLLLEPAALVAPLAGLAARGHDLALVQVLDPSELSLPAAWGPSVFSDPEARERELAADAELVKTGYDAAMHAHLAACRKVAAGCRADHVLANTALPVADVLGPWLHRRRSRT